jgi:hypothetical protein
MEVLGRSTMKSYLRWRSNGWAYIKSSLNHWLKPYLFKLDSIALYLALSVVLVLIGSFFFPSAGRDDAHITYWAAYSLSYFGEVLNYNGDRVEQSSSLLHVVLLAITAFITKIDIVSLGKSSSILFGVASLVALYVLTKKIEPKAAFLAAVLTGTSVYFVYWSFGGLETSLTAFTSLLLILAYGAYFNKQESYFTGMAWVIVATFIFALVRPEMPVVLICMVLGAILTVFILDKFNSANRSQYQNLLFRLLIILGISVVIVFLIIGFRIWYFDSPLPQPVIAKSKELSFNILRFGFIYLKRQITFDLYTQIMSIFTLFSIGYVIWSQLKKKGINPYILLSVLFLAAYTLFILFSGGDWMEGGRFVVPLLPVAMMFPALVLGRLLNHRTELALYKLKLDASNSERSEEPSLGDGDLRYLYSLGITSYLNTIDIVLFIVITILIGIQLATVLDFTAKRSMSLPAWSGIELRDEFVSFPVSRFELMHRSNIQAIPVIHHLDIILDRLYLAKRKNVYIMSGQMGMVPYHIFQQHFGRVRIIDLYGLTDRTFTNCEVTSDVNRGTVGLIMGYGFYFHNRKSIEDICGVPRPDVIFDIRLRDAEVVDNNSYTVMYSQRGQLNNGSEWLKATMDGTFIAVRDDLVPALDGIEPIHLDGRSLLKRK